MCKGKNKEGKSKIGEKGKDDISGGKDKRLFFFLAPFHPVVTFWFYSYTFQTHYFRLLSFCLHLLPQFHPPSHLYLFYSSLYRSFFHLSVPFISHPFNLLYRFLLFGYPSLFIIFIRFSIFFFLLILSFTPPPCSLFLSLPTLHQLPFLFTLPFSSFDNPVT